MTPYCPASVFDAVFVIGHMLASGQPAWCHSDSKKNLQLEQVQLEALASSSAGAGAWAGVSVKPGTSDYERRKQERQQAIKSVPILLSLRVSVRLSLTVWLCLALSWRGLAVVPER